MAAIRMIVCGKIRGGEIYMRVAPRTTAEAVAAIQYGRMLYEAGQSRTHCHNQLEMSGWDEADADCAAALDPLQAYIEEADDTFLDVMEYHEELDWNRRGGWL
jgi:hypothetical protein